MPIQFKKQAKAKNEVKTQAAEPQESTVLKGGIFGFNRTQVNLYIGTLIKKINALEKEKNELNSEKGSLDGGERERLTENYERQISDLSERLNTEKNTSVMLEKECMRLQREVENLNNKLIKKQEDAEIIINTGEIKDKKEAFSSFTPPPKPEHSAVAADINLKEPEKEKSAPVSDGLESLKFDYPEKQGQGSKNFASELSLNAADLAELTIESGDDNNKVDDDFLIPVNNPETPDFGELLAVSEPEYDDEPIKALEKEPVGIPLSVPPEMLADTPPNISANQTAAETVRQVRENPAPQVTPTPQSTPVQQVKQTAAKPPKPTANVVNVVEEIKPNNRVYDDDEIAISGMLYSGEKVEKDDSFADMLFSNEKEKKAKGDDLQALNPTIKDYGDDLIAQNPKEVDKGEDLGEEYYGLYVNDSNISIDDEYDNFFTGGQFGRANGISTDGFDDLVADMPNVSRLGFVNSGESNFERTGEKSRRQNLGNRRMNNISDDSEMSSSVDISDLLSR